jgi:hypothetical protein
VLPYYSLQKIMPLVSTLRHKNQITTNIYFLCNAIDFNNTVDPPAVYRGGEGVKTHTPPPRNSEVLTKLNRISSSVENKSVTT